ncbi:hypothetical protein SLS57_012189 [Botryosphaeria dothidea]
MPLGSGYTVEGQVTGKESVGGLQVEITPQAPYRTWGKTRYRCASQIPMNAVVDSKVQIEWEYEPRLPKLGDFLPVDSFDCEELILTASYYSEDREYSKRALIACPGHVYYYQPPNGQLHGTYGFKSIEIQPRRRSDNYPPCPAGEPRGDYDHGEQWSQSVGQPRGDHEYREGPRSHRVSTRKQKTRSTKPISHSVSSLRTMGIAAGGKLIQDVYKDARGWDGEVSWARYLTKLVNIQIVDSADFEASTHIVPPPTPVSAKNYADAGLPFYLTGESKQDRLKESKILSAIKSVSGLDRKLGVGTSVDNDIDPAKPGKCCTCTGFSAPMNLPGEETYKVNVPVVMLEVKDGVTISSAMEEMRL